jgi:hypothetical protein
MIVKQMEEQASNEIMNAYKALAEVAGINFDKNDTEVYLRNLVNKCVKYGFKAADKSLDSLKIRTSRLENDLTEARDTFKVIDKEAKSFKRELNSIRWDEENNFRQECKKISQENKPSSGVNPFHDAVEDFLNQLEAHSITDESKGQALASFINSMGYLYWQNAKESKSDEQDYKPLRANRTI